VGNTETEVEVSMAMSMLVCVVPIDSVKYEVAVSTSEVVEVWKTVMYCVTVMLKTSSKVLVSDATS
jgi:hypothetical protein